MGTRGRLNDRPDRCVERAASGSRPLGSPPAQWAMAMCLLHITPVVLPAGTGSGVVSVIILFGFRRRLVTLRMTSTRCRNGHVAAHRVVKVTRWFTLFFIPLFPVGTKYSSVCAMCGLQLALTKQEAEGPGQQTAASAPTSAVAYSAQSPGQSALTSAGRVAGQSADRQMFVAKPMPRTVPAQSAEPPPPPAGWFPDPQGAAGMRWWDGTAWTEQVHPGP